VGFLSFAAGESCPTAPGADAFELEKLRGTWYEVGKVQTAGGAIFEGDCKCTSLVYTPIGTDGSASVSNICTNANTGKVTVANATIMPSSPGVFQERFCSFCPAVSYTIVALEGDDFMVEFDCSSTLGILNYCFHVMSRKTTLEEETLEKLKDLMPQYGLNPHNLDWKVTDQDGCWGRAPEDALRMV
jgi:apolipoprotein D and lipocalin family protein